ncbi:MAG: ATP-binding protein [Nitrososphaerota archaeon]|nr:ATP-binding protein [Nitrososphaerota archaeon]
MCPHQETVSKLAEKLRNRQSMYSSALVSCYLHRKGTALENILTLIMPICTGDPLPALEKLDYGEFVLLKTTVSIKELIELILRLPEDKPMDVNFADVNIRIDGRYLGSYDRYDSDTGWINIDWGFEKYHYHANCVGESAILASVDLPLYTDQRSVRREFIGIDQDQYSDAHGILFCLPNYGARIREIKVSSKMLKVSIDTKTEVATNVIGKLSYTKDKETVKEDINFNNEATSSTVDLKFEPQKFHIILLSKNGDILDERKVDFSWHYLPKGVMMDIPEDELLDLIQNGENQIVELKQTMCKSHKFAQTVVAFANQSGGGFIIIGVDDQKNIVGFDTENNYSDTITRIISSHCEPRIVHHTEERMLSEKSKKLLLVKVMEGMDKPYVLREKGVFIRVNGIDRAATRSELDEFYIQKAGNTETFYK